MRPRSKKQKEVAELSSKLPSLSEAAKKWAIDNVVEHYARRCNGVTTCFDCGYNFDKGGLIVDDNVVCPCCGRKAHILYGNYKKKSDDHFFNIMTTIKGHQVMRVFEIKADYRIFEEPKYLIKEVMQQWLDSNLINIVMALPLNMNGYSFQLGGKLSIKTNKNYIYDSFGVTYPITRLTKIIRRNGYKNNSYGVNPIRLISYILQYPHAETLLKAKQGDLLREYCDRSYEHKSIESIWYAVKICIRNNYIVKDAGIFVDHIDLLRQLGYDTHNAKYICIKNLEEVHTQMVEKKRIEDEEKKRVQNIEQERIYNKNYLKDKSKLLDIMFHRGHLSVTPLKSVNEFYEEGKAMHHCVYQCGYYKRKDSLVLSAKVDGKRAETVEVDLTNMEIVQSRGVCNKDSEYHKEVLDLVNENLMNIKQLCS